VIEALLVPQRHHGIDAGGFPRRNGGRQNSHRRQYHAGRSQVIGSLGLTPYSCAVTSLASQPLRIRPMAIPAIAIPGAPRSAIHITVDRRAPSDIRIPISRVRRCTAYAITPYSPMAARSKASAPKNP